MAKKGWTKRLKALFGKGSEDAVLSHEDETKKKGEIWEKEGDGDVVWAYFSVHDEEEKDLAETKEEIIQEELVMDDILVEEGLNEFKKKEIFPQVFDEEEVEKEEETPSLEEGYLDDEIIYTGAKDLSEKAKVTQEKIVKDTDMEEEKLLKNLFPSEEFTDTLKRAYIKYIKHKYPFRDFSYLDKHIYKEDPEEDIHDKEEDYSLPVSPYERAFIEMQQKIDGSPYDTVVSDEVSPGVSGVLSQEDYYLDNSISTTDFFGTKKDDNKVETVTSKEVNDKDTNTWVESKYGDFFSDTESFSVDTVILNEKGDVSGEEVDKKTMKQRYADIAQSVNQGKTSTEETALITPVTTKDAEIELSQEEEKTNPDEMLEKANKELELGWKDKGITLLKKAAYLYKRNRELEKAFPLYERLHNFDPTNINFIYSLGFICKELGRLDEAKIHFRNVLKIELTHKETLFQLGLISFEEGSLDTALIAIKKVISLDPSYGDAYKKLGKILEKKGDTGEAINNYFKGATYFIDKEEKAIAIDLLKRILQLEPDNEEALNKLTLTGFDHDREMETHILESSEKDISDTSKASVNLIVQVSEFAENTDSTNQEESIEELKSTTKEVEEKLKKKDLKSSMKLNIKIEPNLEDFLEEISIEYHLDPSIEKISKHYIDEFVIPSAEEIRSEEILYNSFMEDFIDEFEIITDKLEDYNNIDLWAKYEESISKTTNTRLIEKLKSLAHEFSVRFKPQEVDTRDIKNLYNIEENMEEFEFPQTIEKVTTEESEIKELQPVETGLLNSIYESLSEEFIEEFTYVDIQTDSEEKAIGIGSGLDMEEEEELEEEELEEEELEKEELEEEELGDKIEEEIEEEELEDKIEEDKIEEDKVKPEKVKPEELEKEIEEKVEVKETVEEVKAIKKASGETKEPLIEDVENEIARCKENLKKNFKKLDEVINIYETLYEKYPEYYPLCCAIGAAYIKKGLHIKGIKYFMKTVEKGAFEKKDNFLSKLT